MPLRFPSALAVLAALVLGLAGGGRAEANGLPSYKDSLFAYPKILASHYGGDFLVVEYVKQRDLHQRDKEPEREVWGNYVSYHPRSSQTDLEISANGRKVKFMAVGKTGGGARMVVIYIHGQGGNRFQGMNDVTFGGNFNRIKNLMSRNGGVYLSAEFADFGPRGTEDVKALIRTYAANSPGAPIMVACGSMGGILCWNLLKDGSAARLLSGVLFFGSPKDEAFLSSATLSDRARHVPIYLGHGSSDEVYDWEGQARFFEAIKKRAPSYPVKFTLFDTGTHGTPIRMTDWRLVLNWMLAQR
ncbi:phospholipase [Polymorphum gilvum]|uniref:Phospholipase/Carboxylesterase n=1 Tax=Polymorphum gilvum (strain LMG 25793 / CGMCC 1.9160 / SL003B-26A1) TaxID=991905 RepID=F2IWC1_POLGS|nr:phospholipase [Polymorphum gilvum]ADZ71506.1 Phospholipase/Carboxylesterase [Polymorphum gilvum SL003B-26A1]